MRRRKAHGRVTLADVARHAGVSTASVSRALNLPQSVAVDIRERVASAVTALGYRPNAAAQALAGSRSRMIGIIVPTIANSIFAPGVQAIEETLEAANFGLVIASSGYDPAREFEQARRLVARGMDGLILVGLHHEPSLPALIAEARIPVVIQGAYAPDSVFPCIGFDNHAAMSLMAEHVIGLGHRRIAVLSGVSASNDRVADRVRALRNACKAAALSAPVVVESPYDIAQARAAASGLLAAEPRPTAIVCINDILAIGAVLAARDLGLAAPRDVSVTGFDDFDIAASFQPSITTIRVPVAEMGRQVAAALLKSLAEGDPIRAQEVSVQFISRESSGPPCS